MRTLWSVEQMKVRDVVSPSQSGRGRLSAASSPIMVIRTEASTAAQR